MFGNAAFTAILVASAISSVGIAMFDTATSWLMTSLNPNPLMVSAVQVATMAPMFLMTIPAGALADVVDPRRLLIAAQIGSRPWARPSQSWLLPIGPPATTLLGTTFLLGAAGALAAPAWQIITPVLVPKPELDAAIAVEQRRLQSEPRLGPALGGVAITAFGIRLPFWVYVATNVSSLADADMVAPASQGAGDAARRAVVRGRSPPDCATRATTATSTRR